MCSSFYARIALGAKMTPLDRGGFALVLVVQLLLETAPPFTDRGSDDTSPGPRCAPVLLTMQCATRLDKRRTSSVAKEERCVRDSIQAR
jgi:hypothetical protein